MKKRRIMISYHLLYNELYEQREHTRKFFEFLNDVFENIELIVYSDDHNKLKHIDYDKESINDLIVIPKLLKTKRHILDEADGRTMLLTDDVVLGELFSVKGLYFVVGSFDYYESLLLFIENLYKMAKNLKKS